MVGGEPQSGQIKYDRSPQLERLIDETELLFANGARVVCAGPHALRYPSLCVRCAQRREAGVQLCSNRVDGSDAIQGVITRVGQARQAELRRRCRDRGIVVRVRSRAQCQWLDVRVGALQCQLRGT